MAELRDGMPNWFDTVDFRQELHNGKGTDSTTPLFVDVGGAMGQQCIFFKKAYPDLERRVIVQDQTQVVSQIQAYPLPGFERIEAMAHDFFQPQKLKAIEILRHLKDAMTESSYLLIGDTVLSEKQAPWKAAFLDMTMICQLGAQERTKAEWERLTAESGFMILEICEYAPASESQHLTSLEY